MKLNEVHERAMEDARRYTPALIIAQRMVLDGFTYAEAHKILATRNDPLSCNVLNGYPRHHSQRIVDRAKPRRLKQLAKQLR
jgi:hypothetical protein